MSANSQYNDHQEKMQGENAKEKIFLEVMPFMTLNLQELVELLGMFQKKVKTGL